MKRWSYAPGHPAIIHNLGVIAAANGHHHEAIAQFERRDRRRTSIHIRALQPRLSARRRSADRATPCKLCARLRLSIPGITTLIARSAFSGSPKATATVRSITFARTYELRRGEDRSGIANKSLDLGGARQAAARRRAVPLPGGAPPGPAALARHWRATIRPWRKAFRTGPCRCPTSNSTGSATITTPRSISAAHRDRGPRRQRTAGPRRLACALSRTRGRRGLVR